MPRMHIRVTKTEDGKVIRRELMDGDTRVAELSRTDVVEMVMQFASTLRYDD